MRVAYLNPWANSAENQAFRSLEIAAGRLGHELLHCTNTDEVKLAAPDFILATASIQPKLTKFPTYGVIHEPRDRFLDNRAYFNNLLTYDGYLTISDTLESFLKSLLSGVGRRTDIGFYYNSCQANVADTGFLGRLRRGELKITYFGTNWDRRRTSFFKRLSNLDGIAIYGPEASWETINPKSYGGFIPFDGFSVQDKYRENGIGLVMLSDRHLADNIISNRIFEITSVGAIAICCRIPWLEHNFGDSVYYFNQQCSDTDLIDQIEAAVDEITNSPNEAYNRSQRAYEIFHSRFSGEKLMQNAIHYHMEMTDTKGASDRVAYSTPAPQPFVSIVVRCGGRPPEALRRALKSVAEQTVGRFDVILVRYKALDLGDIIDEFAEVFQSFRCLDCLGGNRSKTLWCGLNSIRGDYFAILDDDDELLPNHFASLFASGDHRGAEPYFAYSGFISSYLELKNWSGLANAAGNRERRFIHDDSFGIRDCRSFFEQSRFFAPNCFVASSSLLDRALLVDPELDTAEDSYLVLSLLARTKAKFSYRATALHNESEAASKFEMDPNRKNDVLNMHLRLLPWYVERAQSVDIHEVLREQNATLVSLMKYQADAGEHDNEHQALQPPATDADFAVGRILECDSLDCLPILAVGVAGIRPRLPDGCNSNVIHAKLGVAGFLAYGPYITLRPGRYEAEFAFRSEPGARFNIDVAADMGAIILARRHLKSRRPMGLFGSKLGSGEKTLACSLDFEVAANNNPSRGRRVELRVWSPGTTRFSLVALRLRQVAASVQFRGNRHRH